MTTCTLVGKYQNIGRTSSLYLQWQYTTPSSSWMYPHQFSFPTLARTKWPLLGHSPQLPRFLSYPIQSHVTKFSARLNLKGENRFLQKCGTYVMNYTASRLRRPQFSLPYAQRHARIRWNQVTPTHFTFLKIYFSIILSLCLASSSSPALEYPTQNFVYMHDSLSSPAYWREILRNRKLHLKFVKIDKF